ncbi:AAA-like domain-containing protein [Microcoleus sp. F10-B4]
MNRHRLNWSNQEICDLMEMVGTHPYLVRVALYQVAKGRITLERLLTKSRSYRRKPLLRSFTAPFS